MKIMLFLILCSLVFSTKAHRPYHSRELLLSLGFKKVELKPKFKIIKSSNHYGTNSIEHHSLNWPIELQRPENQFMGNLHQYQDFTNPPYYHAGVDILANEDQEVITPVSGIIEAGYYSYTDDYYGHTDKYFLPLKDALENETLIPWGKEYFEVAIIDSDGNRLEFHHMDAANLPPDIMGKILQENQMVESGSVLGKVYNWNIKRGDIPTRHIHYNIINSQGHYLNPFRFSKLYPDLKSPKITNIYGTKTGFCYKVPELIEFTDEPMKTEGYIVVRAYDTVNDSIFSQAPMIILAEFEDGSNFTWDFSETIVDKTGQRPNLRDVYLVSQCFPLRGTESKASTKHDFYIKIPVNPYYHGKVKITVFDQRYNATSKVISLIGESI